MRRPHFRPSKDFLCDFCRGRIRWAGDDYLYGARRSRHAHKKCYAEAASSEAAKPLPSGLRIVGKGFTSLWRRDTNFETDLSIVLFPERVNDEEPSIAPWYRTALINYLDVVFFD
jgi:hypothetical protein